MDYRYEREFDIGDLQAGDSLTIDSFSQVAKSSKEMLQFIADLHETGARLISIEEGLDTKSPEGAFFSETVCRIRQLDRDTWIAKQRIGIEAARENGKYRGRKPISIDTETFDTVVASWQAGEITAREAMAQLNLKANTFYRRVKERTTEMKNTEEIKAAAEKLGEQLKNSVNIDINKDELKTAATKLAEELAAGAKTDAAEVKENAEKIIEEYKNMSLKEIKDKVVSDIESGDLADKVKAKAEAVGAEIDIQKDNLQYKVQNMKDRIELEKQVREEAQSMKVDASATEAPAEEAAAETAEGTAE